MDKRIIFLFFAGILFIASGCAPSISGGVYSRSAAREVQTVQTGTVLYVREVMVEGTQTGIGAAAGGVMGYVLGETIGSGSGRDIARAAGAIGGAAAGAAAEEGLTRTNALEITVELENGQSIAIVQGKDEMFYPGQAVKIIRRPDGTARVVQ